MTPPKLLDALPEIAGRIDRSPRIFLGLDFDGTLAPIRPTPDEVALDRAVRGWLDGLSRMSGVTVAIVSGRSIADVSARVALPGLIYAGNHGLEIAGPEVHFIEPTAAALSGELGSLASRLSGELAEVPGALVEPKGLTASVHDRNVPPADRPRVEWAVRRAAEGADGRFVIQPGLCVWEIRPWVDWHKGKAVAAILDALGRSEPLLPIYLGDDRTDEDAFAAIPDGITARVGPPRPTAARYALESPVEVAFFLRWLLENRRERARAAADGSDELGGACR
ncbi:MAG: trehalose-phosphatase [Isosphaeraceae bacterium]